MKPKDPELRALEFMARWFSRMPSKSAQARAVAWFAHRFSDVAAEHLYACARKFREEDAAQEPTK